MKFWKNNRLDAEFDLPEAEVARLFAESEWADNPWPLDRRLRAFLTDPAGPVSAVWDDEDAYQEVRRLTQAGQGGRRHG
jgi:hypothetical protein